MQFLLLHALNYYHLHLRVQTIHLRHRGHPPYHQEEFFYYSENHVFAQDALILDLAQIWLKYYQVLWHVINKGYLVH